MPEKFLARITNPITERRSCAVRRSNVTRITDNLVGLYIFNSNPANYSYNFGEELRASKPGREVIYR